MRKQYHILNGDSLKQNFPEEIQGEVIVARECLVDGDVQGRDLNELLSTRAKFISQNYGGSEQDYYLKTASELCKISKIMNNCDINLWFEDDLFCQVNFWFVVNLLLKEDIDSKIFILRPEIHTQYGFSGFKKDGLISIYKNKLELIYADKIASLWELYQKNDLEKLINTARELENKYSFILPAVMAHYERKPSNRNGNLGRPKQTLIKIIEELGTDDFGTVFKEFNKLENIYGFGDLQVKRLYDEIINK